MREDHHITEAGGRCLHGGNGEDIAILDKGVHAETLALKSEKRPFAKHTSHEFLKLLAGKR
jgi:hypothetical protein